LESTAKHSEAPPRSPLEWSPEARRQIAWILGRYPTKRAALLPVLRVAESEFDGIGPRAIQLVARELELSPGYVYGVFTFYTQFRREGEGRYVLQVCSTLSCALRGCRELVQRLEQKLGIAPGETTADGLFTLKKVECLGSCDTAPVVQVNDDYHEGLDVAKLDALLETLKAAPAGGGR
jgi:NADH-quinone oxidoreductase subunit E